MLWTISNRPSEVNVGTSTRSEQGWEKRGHDTMALTLNPNILFCIGLRMDFEANLAS